MSGRMTPQVDSGAEEAWQEPRLELVPLRELQLVEHEDHPAAPAQQQPEAAAELQTRAITLEGTAKVASCWARPAERWVGISEMSWSLYIGG